MAIMLAIGLIYIGFAGSEALMGDEDGARMKWLRENGIKVFAAFAVAYMLIPIAIIALFSFNDPEGKFNFTWSGFTTRALAERVHPPGPSTRR